MTTLSYYSGIRFSYSVFFYSQVNFFVFCFLNNNHNLIIMLSGKKQKCSRSFPTAAASPDRP